MAKIWWRVKCLLGLAEDRRKTKRHNDSGQHRRIDDETLKLYDTIETNIEALNQVDTVLQSRSRKIAVNQ